MKISLALIPDYVRSVLMFGRNTESDAEVNVFSNGLVPMNESVTVHVVKVFL